MYNTPYQFNNSYPTATQPYGYSMQGYMPQPQPQAQPQTSTNKIYVSGIEDVRQRALPFNSDFIFIDNDKPLIYQKTIDSKGQFEVKTFTIAPYLAKESEDKTATPNLLDYAKTSDLEPIKADIKAIKEYIFGTQGDSNAKG